MRPLVALLSMPMLLAACSAARRPTVESAADDAPCESAAAAPLELDDAGDRAVAPPRASPELARALERYERGELERAAVELDRVVQAGVAAPSPEVRYARLVLAKTLVRLGYLHRAASVAGELVQDAQGGAEGGADAAILGRALVLLAVLADRLPDPRHALDVAAAVPASVETPSTPGGEALAERIDLLRGRALYDSGNLEQAPRFLGAVPPGSRWYEEARFLIGVAYVRRGRAVEALRAFQDMGMAAVEDDHCTSPDAVDLRDLAALSVGRLLYAAGATEAADRAALRAYGGVAAGSPHHPQATLERAWLHYRLGEHERARRLIDGLPEPFLRVSLEAAVLGVTIDTTLGLDRAGCSSGVFDEARAFVAGTRQTWAPVVEGLGQLAGSPDDEPALGLLEGRGLDGAPPLLREVVARELDSRTLHRARACLGQVEVERRLLERAGQELRASDAGLAIAEGLDADLAGERAGLAVRVRSHLQRAAAELAELLQDLTGLGQSLGMICEPATPSRAIP